MKTKKQTKKQVAKKIKSLCRKVWKVFSEFVRRRDESAGCFCCGVKKHWKDMNASHLFHNKLDFSPHNINSCCRKCNTFLHGNLGAYTEKFIEKYGWDVYQELKKKSHEAWAPDITELERLLEHWTQELKKLRG